MRGKLVLRKRNLKSGFRMRDAWEIGFTEAEFEVWLQNAADRSCFTSEIAPNISDHILTLSTCSYEFDDARFVLVGALR